MNVNLLTSSGGTVFGGPGAAGRAVSLSPLSADGGNADGTSGLLPDDASPVVNFAALFAKQGQAAQVAQPTSKSALLLSNIAENAGAGAGADAAAGAFGMSGDNAGNIMTGNGMISSWGVLPGKLTDASARPDKGTGLDFTMPDAALIDGASVIASAGVNAGSIANGAGKKDADASLVGGDVFGDLLQSVPISDSATDDAMDQDAAYDGAGNYSAAFMASFAPVPAQSSANKIENKSQDNVVSIRKEIDFSGTVSLFSSASAVNGGQSQPPENAGNLTGNDAQAGEATALLARLRGVFTPAAQGQAMGAEGNQNLTDGATSASGSGTAPIAMVGASANTTASNVTAATSQPVPSQLLPTQTAPAQPAPAQSAPFITASVIMPGADAGGLTNPAVHQAAIVPTVPQDQQGAIVDDNGDMGVTLTLSSAAKNKAHQDSGSAFQDGEGQASAASASAQSSSAGSSAPTATFTMAAPVAPAPAPNAAAVVASPVGAALSQQVIDLGVSGQWIDDIAREIASMSENQGQGSFRIASPHLGGVKVDMTPGAQGMDIRMTVENELAQSALMKDQSRLLQDAEMAALRIGDVRIDRAPAQDPSRTESNPNNQQQGQNNGQTSTSQNGGQGHHSAARQDMAGTNDGNSPGNNAKTPFTKTVMKDVGGADAGAVMRGAGGDSTRYA